MTMAHVIQGLPRTAGTTVFIREMAAAQAKLGHRVSLYYYAKGEDCDDGPIDKVELRQISRPEEIGKDVDLVHYHAVWSICAVRTMAWCKRNRIPYVVSIHGCLMPRVFQHGRLKKAIFYHFILKRLLNSAAAIHTTGAGETEAVHNLGLRPPIIELPLGCNLPILAEDSKPMKQILFLGRLSEEKGLETLLDAWKSVGRKDWELILAGPDWLGYKRVLDDKIASEGIGGVVFTGSADEKMKDQLYKDASYFVLASPVENFSMVVLDALAYGVPVICTTGTPWKCVVENYAGWWIKPNSSKSLCTALDSAISLPEEGRMRMSKNACKLAEGFSWNSIAERMCAQYAKFSGK